MNIYIYIYIERERAIFITNMCVCVCLFVSCEQTCLFAAHSGSRCAGPVDGATEDEQASDENI